MKFVPTFLVAVDFSPASNKAVEYAVVLARMLFGKIHLIHIADPDEITESDNQVVVMRGIHRVLEQARARMRSYQEMIWEKWQVRVTHSVSLGLVESTLPMEIKKANPDFVLLGKNGTHSSLLASLISDIQLPILVVPASVKVHEPKELLLATDLRPLDADLVKPLLNLSGKESRVLRLLHISTLNGRNGVQPEKITAQFSQQLSVNTELVHRKDHDAVSGVRMFLESNGTDLICTVRRPKGFFKRLFSDSVAVKVAMQATVPALIITEGAH